jgi:hypothetical protein
MNGICGKALLALPLSARRGVGVRRKLFIKSTAFKMRMPRNGCRTRRSLSPVMMQAAFAEIANSRNLLSFGSRQSVILSDISQKRASRLKSLKILNLVSLEIYLSNLERRNTSKNSLYVAILADIFPAWFAFLSAFRGSESLKREELISVFVSITKMLFLIQQLLKDFFCKSIPRCLITCFIEKGFKMGHFNFLRNYFDQVLKVFSQPAFYFRRNIVPFFSGSIIHFNYDPFHAFLFLFFPKLQNNKSSK